MPENASVLQGTLWQRRRDDSVGDRIQIGQRYWLIGVGVVIIVDVTPLAAAFKA